MRNSFKVVKKHVKFTNCIVELQSDLQLCSQISLSIALLFEPLEEIQRRKFPHGGESRREGKIIHVDMDIHTRARTMHMQIY